jgi:hypothetical protein
LGLIGQLETEAPDTFKRPIDGLRKALLLHQPGPAQIQAVLAAGKGFESLQGLSPSATRTAKMIGVACRRWAAMARGDNNLSTDWVETAETIAAEDNIPATQLLADYYLHVKKVHQASPAQAEPAIRSFAESRQDLASLDADTRMLAMASALERGLDAPRRKLQAELSSLDMLAIPRVRGLMRDWVRAQPEVELKLRFELALTGLDGKEIRIGQRIEGDAIVVHFWSAAAPIGSAGVWAWQEEPPSAYAIKKPREGVTIVAVNVDGDLDAARELADRHPDWVHAWCPEGWRDPTLRALDVTAVPSSWVFGHAGGVLADDTAVSVREALEDRMKMSTWVLFWRDVTLGQWYLRGMRLWLGFQARPAGKALFGEDLFPAKREKEYRRGYDWLTGNGLRNAIRTSAQPIHRQILDTVGKMSEADKPSAASRTRLAGLYRQLADLEGYLDRMNKLTEDDDWPDWAPEASAINDQRHRLYTIDQRRHRPGETLRKRMDELFGPRRDGRWWSLKPAPQWLDLEGPAD